MLFRLKEACEKFSYEILNKLMPQFHASILSLHGHVMACERANKHKNFSLRLG